MTGTIAKRPNVGVAAGLSIAALVAMREQAKSQVTQLDGYIADLTRIETGVNAFGIATPLAQPTNGVQRRVGRKPGPKTSKVKASKGSTTPTGRVRNESNITDALTNMFVKRANQPMTISEILDGVQADGYKSASPNFRGIVNRALVLALRHFHRVGRGQYNLQPKVFEAAQTAAATPKTEA